MTNTAEPTVGVEKFNRIYVRDCHAWCKLLWQENGWVIVLSDYGNWAFWWGHRGEGVTVPQFLSRLDREYMGRKMLGSDLYEFSLASTVQCIREVITSHRKNCGMTKAEARREWDLCRQLEDGEIPFDSWFAETSLDDGCECRRDEVCGAWSQFWSRLWVPLIQPLLLEKSKL